VIYDTERDQATAYYVTESTGESKGELLPYQG
jgi:hypothetical protein